MACFESGSIEEELNLAQESHKKLTHGRLSEEAGVEPARHFYSTSLVLKTAIGSPV